MQQCAPPQGSTLLMVPQCLAAARGRGFESDGCWLRRLAGGGHFAVAQSVAESMEAGFLPALDVGGRRSGRYVHPVGVAPVQTRSGPQVTNQGYPGLSQFIWIYTWLTHDIKSFPIFRWTVEVLPLQGGQARR